MRSLRAAAVLALGVVAGSACGLTAEGDARSAAGGKAAGDRVRVAAAFYPLAFVAERVGGDRVAVTNLTKPGAEPHDVEMTPSQLEHLESADVVLTLSGFQPAVDDAAPPARTLDVAKVQPLLPAHDDDHEGEDEHADESEQDSGDPHFWLDPTRLATVADAVAKRLGEVDATNAQQYADRAAALRTELLALDKEYADGLAACKRREIVVSHEAFGYLADRYELEQLGISGLDPESDPSPARVTEVARFVREHKVGTIFFESLVSPKVAKTIADETGATTAALDPVEGIANDGDDYFSVMRVNLAALRTALDCGGG